MLKNTIYSKLYMEKRNLKNNKTVLKMKIQHRFLYFYLIENRFVY